MKSPRRGFPGRWPLGAMLLAAGLLTASCQTTDSAATEAAGADVGAAIICLAFAPIAWSKYDTPETQKQAVIHNAIGADLCGWKAPTRNTGDAS